MPLQRKPFPLLLSLLIGLWSALLGWGGAVAMEKGSNAVGAVKSVDVLPARLEVALEVYRDRCGSCHLAIPAEVFPMQTWQQLLQKPQDHYGTTLKTIIRPELLLMWDYLSTASRPLQQGEATPYRFGNSRYFKILHPRVDLPNPISHSTCITCHPGAKDFNFRRLTAEWEDAP